MRWSERARRSLCFTTDAKSTDEERRPALPLPHALESLRHPEVCVGPNPITLLPSSLLCMIILVADVTLGAIRLLLAAGLVKRRFVCVTIVALGRGSEERRALPPPLGTDGRRKFTPLR